MKLLLLSLLIFCSLVLCLLFWCTESHDLYSNLIEDGSFENNGLNWKLPTVEACVFPPTSSQDGLKHMQLTCSQVGPFGPRSLIYREFSAYSRPINICGEKKMRFSGYFKSRSNARAYIRVLFTNTISEYIDEQYATVQSVYLEDEICNDKWQQVERIFSVPKSADTIHVTCGAVVRDKSLPHSGGASFDNLSLCAAEVNYPAASFEELDPREIK